MMKYLLAPSLFLLASTACNGNKKGETSPESTGKEQTKSESARHSFLSQLMRAADLATALKT